MREPNKIIPLQDLADRINIAKLDLIDTESSEIARHRQETKIDAVKAARAKAQYLMESIGERVGKTVFVKEQDEEQVRPAYGYTANVTSNTTSRVSLGVMNSQDDDPLSFTQIKLRYVIVARFLIE